MSSPDFGFTGAAVQWDPQHWRPTAVAHRCRVWVGQTRRRRAAVWAVIALIALFVCPGLLAVAASADSTSAAGSTASAANSALGWMDIKDHDGVALSSYMFTTNHGSLLHPGNFGLSLFIGVLFAIWLVMVTTGTWLPTDTMDFGWLKLISGPLEGVAHALAGQVATTVVLTAAATIGAFFVGWFIVRGLHAKAVTQIVTMIVVALFGPIFLAAPLAEALAPHGLLAQGRDLGLSVAAGLNGNSNPNPNQLVVSMQADMAENFARKPLQVWNFGHVIDSSPACRAAWSAGVKAGDEDRVKSGLKSCGDRAAFEAADNPSFGQIGAGILLLLSGLILLLFGAYLAIKVIWAALDTIYYGFLSIFGFAAGGFIYGPTQTFTVRCVVHGFISAGRMAAFVIFLGIWELVLADLFAQAKGQVMAVFVIGAIFEIIAIMQLKRLSASIDKGNDWVANRFALAIQNGGAVQKGSGGGGGTALGMGDIGASNKGHLGFLATLGAASTISNSPPTEWLAGGVPGFWHPQARQKARMHKLAKEMGMSRDFSGMHGAAGMAVQNRLLYRMAAKEAAKENGGINSVRGAAAAVQAVLDVGGLLPDTFGAMDGAGFRKKKVMYRAIRSRGVVAAAAEDETMADKDLSFLVAAVKRSQASAHKLMYGEGGDPDSVAADFATMEMASKVFRRNKAGGVTLDNGRNEGPERDFVNDFMRNPTKEKMKLLQEVGSGNHTNVAGTLLEQVGGGDVIERQRAASRLNQWIGNEFAARNSSAMRTFMADVSNPDALRDVRTSTALPVEVDRDASGLKTTPWASMSVPKTGPPNVQFHRRWSSTMGEVDRRFR
ncbi:hypothetical protein [Nocardia callitridis]|uniref:TrbL/VirB6 plasmid conjugal transfer protein n=1 Tax=Nocardia callitridis TaxID=648753 RepID=A0ABP9KQF2_9NOCA